MIKSFLHNIEKLILKAKKKKYILCFVHNDVMAEHIKPYCELFRNDKRFKVYLCFSRLDLLTSKDRDRLKKQLGCTSVPYKIAKHLLWDLALYPDHHPWLRDDVKKVFTGHGIPVMPKDSGDIYGFRKPYTLRDDGDLVYDAFFSSSEFVKKLGEDLTPQLAGTIKVVGSFTIDILDKQNKALMKKPSVASEKIKVFIISTWGEHSIAQSFWHEMVKEINLSDKKYEFYISIHPNNFNDRYNNNNDWDKLFSEQTKKGNTHIVKDTFAFLSKNQVDLFLTDHTSLHFFVPVYGKPIIFLKFKDGPFSEDVSQKTKLYYQKYADEDIASYSYLIEDFKDLNTKLASAKEEHSKAKMFEALSFYYANNVGQTEKRVYEEVCKLLELSTHT
jgi:hypothetical protein